MSNHNSPHKTNMMGWNQERDSSKVTSLPPLDRSLNISQQPKILRFKDPVAVSTPRRRPSRLPSVSRQESMISYEPMVARFVKNGDKFFEGVKVNVSKKSIRCWEVLLSELSRRIDLPAGVRHIYTPIGGHRVTNLSQLEHQHTYVCASTEPFKRIDYESVKNPDWKSATKIRNPDAELQSVFSKNFATSPMNLNVSLNASMRSIHSLNSSFRKTSQSEEERSIRIRRPSQRLKPLRLTSISEPGEITAGDAVFTRPLSPPLSTKLTVYRNGPPPRQSAEIYLNRDAIKSWEDARKLISENLNTVNGYLRLFKPNGNEVQSLSQLWKAGGILIAAGNEKFDIAEFLRAPLNTVQHSNGEKPTGTARPLQETTLKGNRDQESSIQNSKDLTSKLKQTSDSEENVQQTTVTTSTPIPELSGKFSDVTQNNTNNGQTETQIEPKTRTKEVERSTEEETSANVSSDSSKVQDNDKQEDDSEFKNGQKQTSPPKDGEITSSDSEIRSERNPLPATPAASLILKFPPTPLSSDISPAVSPIDGPLQRPRALSLISTTSSMDANFETPIFSPANRRFTLQAHRGLSIHPQTPQSEISTVGMVQSIVDMILPRQIRLYSQSESSTYSNASSKSSETLVCVKRTIGIQTEFTGEHLSTIIEPADDDDDDEIENNSANKRLKRSKVNSMESQTDLISKNAAEDEVRRNKQTREKYHIGPVMEEGNFVILKQCKEKKTNREFTLRVINKAKVFGHEDIVLREITVMKMLHHENILQVLDHWDLNDEMCQVMELIEGTDLFDAILYCQHFSEADTAIAMRQLGLALVYLHANMIVHRDIKPENIFLTVNAHGEWTLKLGGFSLAAAVSEPLSLVCGNHYYRAPEMIRETGYGTKLDVWSAGIICYILLSGTMPFGRKSKTNMFANTLLGRFSFPSCYWSGISKDAKDFIRHLLVVSPQQRYSSSQMLQHSWLNKQVEVKTPSSSSSSSEEELEPLSKKLRDHLMAKASDMKNAAVPVLTITALDQHQSLVTNSKNNEYLHHNR